MPIDNLNDCVPEQSITNSDIFPLGSYLAGLVEGDGTIVVPKTERSASLASLASQASQPKGKLNYPCINLVFNLRDFPLAQLIQKELGTGSLSRMKGVNAYLLQINSFEGVLKLVNLLIITFRNLLINTI